MDPFSHGIIDVKDRIVSWNALIGFLSIPNGIWFSCQERFSMIYPHIQIYYSCVLSGTQYQSKLETLTPFFDLKPYGGKSECQELVKQTWNYLDETRARAIMQFQCKLAELQDNLQGWHT